MKRMLTGALGVLAVYFYFLIYAQFAFLGILDDLHYTQESLRVVMGCMAVGGVLGSIGYALLSRKFTWPLVMKNSALSCGLVALVSSQAQNFGFDQAALSFIAGMIGLSLGCLTVSLAVNLIRLSELPVWSAALGTGLAYMMSNMPWIFESSPSTQAILSGVVVILICLLPLGRQQEAKILEQQGVLGTYPVGLVWLTLLVWLDSAAFYIIQHQPEIKEATWGNAYLLRNGGIHLVAALLSGWLVRKGRLKEVLVGAFVLLGGAGLMASHSGLVKLAGCLYPVGVSLYSVALVVYPVVLLGKVGGERRTVLLFSIAGWIGSAMGIGMAQDLHHVPLAFVVTAGVVFIISGTWQIIRKRKVESSVCLLAVLASVLSSQFMAKGNTEPAKEQSSWERGRQVYVDEGCIHCHSRYVRPDSPDVLLWGPASVAEEETKKSPVLIGNRRQGPDLRNVGLRRSRAWMKQHFMNPRDFVGHSVMPSYKYLFEDDRGDSLLDFLTHYSTKEMTERMTAVYEWKPVDIEGDDYDGRDLFKENCAMCHGAEGKGDGKLAHLWARPPVNLVNGPFIYSAGAKNYDQLSRIIKFGIPGTDMPGHETLSDADVADLADYIYKLRTNHYENK